jgi:hypothetical protein
VQGILRPAQNFRFPDDQLEENLELCKNDAYKTIQNVIEGAAYVIGSGARLKQIIFLTAINILYSTHYSDATS